MQKDIKKKYNNKLFFAIDSKQKLFRKSEIGRITFGQLFIIVKYLEEILQKSIA